MLSKGNNRDNLKVQSFLNVLVTEVFLGSFHLG
jgi:hypothetical protein